MRRREFIAAIGGATVLSGLGVLASRAQQPMPTIGFLSSRSPSESTGLVTAFRQGLGDAGFIEGQNITIAFRWAEGRYDRLPALAAELVGLRVYSRQLVTQLVSASSPASTGRAATSRA